MEINWQSVDGRFFCSVDKGHPLSWREVLAGWCEQPDFGLSFSQFLAELDPVAFRWETPAVTTATLDQPFEFVITSDPALDVVPDPGPFAEHFARAGKKAVITFPNLGGDAVLVVPCRQGPARAYGHLAAFVRQAPQAQQQALWKQVATAMAHRLGERSVWLSTAGGGVAWLHVRLDDRPKYYGYAPYREPT